MGMSPEDPGAVRADDEMIELLRAGWQPPASADRLWVLLAAWRDDARQAGDEESTRERGESG
jgi:hypothetical protein